MDTIESGIREKYPEMSDREVEEMVKLQQRKNKAEEGQRKLISKISKKKKNARTKTLCDLGGLVLKAGIGDWKKSELLGVFLEAKGQEAMAVKRQQWEGAGEKAFREDAEAEKARSKKA